jgi:hypothetical protein
MKRGENDKKRSPPPILEEASMSLAPPSDRSRPGILATTLVVALLALPAAGCKPTGGAGPGTQSTQPPGNAAATTGGSPAPAGPQGGASGATGPTTIGGTTGNASEFPPAGGTSGAGTGGMPSPPAGAGGSPSTQPAPPPKDLAAACNDYCTCMLGGRCKPDAPADCLATCMKDGAKWAIACRLDKCKTAENDYHDQYAGDCWAAIGRNGCLDKQ